MRRPVVFFESPVPIVNPPGVVDDVPAPKEEAGPSVAPKLPPPGVVEDILVLGGIPKLAVWVVGTGPNVNPAIGAVGAGANPVETGVLFVLVPKAI